MNNNERPGLRPVDQIESMLRHPSRFGEAQQRHAAEQLCGIGLHLYEYFRFGAPEATQELELFLHEGGAGRHAEVMLDELATALMTLGVGPEQGAA